MQEKDKKFNLVSQEWLKYKKLEVKISTYVKYEKIIKCHLNDLYQDKNIDELDAYDYRDYFTKLKEDNQLSPSMLNSIRTVLKGILEYAEERYNIEHVDLSRIKLSRSKTVATVLSDDEFEKLSQYCEENINIYTVPSYLSLYSGMRLGEICGLKWQDIDVVNGVIYVRRTVERLEDEDNPDSKTTLMLLEPKTESSKREVTIVNFLCKYLLMYKQLCDGQDTDYIVTNNDKIPDPTTVERRHKRLCLLLNISNYKFHTLRHTFATECVKQEVDYKVLCETLGHSDVSITLNVYVHPSREFKKEQIDKISKKKK
ncbi:MAG: site-specific integrase [Erysipelotrichaceae bacterium]|nr:site-specific integrase [Erysipelotrichaceae bacterium]